MAQTTYSGGVENCTKIVNAGYSTVYTAHRTEMTHILCAVIVLSTRGN